MNSRENSSLWQALGREGELRGDVAKNEVKKLIDFPARRDIEGFTSHLGKR
jgi:hypothetical protein